MQVITVLLMITNLVKIALGDFKSCSEESDKAKLCFTNKNGYETPTDKVVGTTFILKEINQIKVDENSIDIQGSLWTTWTDPGLAARDNSTL